MDRTQHRPASEPPKMGIIILSDHIASEEKNIASALSARFNCVLFIEYKKKKQDAEEKSKSFDFKEN